VSIAGHLGVGKTLEWLRCDAFWIKMAKDVEEYCRQCPSYQQSKPHMPQYVPLHNILIGQSWQMVVVDILLMPLSTNINRYSGLFY